MQSSTPLRMFKATKEDKAWTVYTALILCCTVWWQHVAVLYVQDPGK